MSTITVTTIYLVRHGETDHNRDGIYQGTLDTPLNDEGRWQAHTLGRRLMHIPFTAVYSSPLVRARETADIIIRESRGTCIYNRPRALSQHNGPRLRSAPPPVMVIPELQEFSYGSWQGMSEGERQLADADLERLWRTDPWQVRFPQGESLHDVHTRVSQVIDTLVARHRSETILVSGHGHVNRIIIAYLARFDRESFWDIKQPNGCCSKLTIRE